MDEGMKRKPSTEATSAWIRLMRVQSRVLDAVEQDLKKAGFPHWIGMDDDHAGSAYLFCHGCSWSGSPKWNAA